MTASLCRLLAILAIVIYAGCTYTGPDGVERFCPEASVTLYVHREGFTAGKQTANTPRPQLRRVWCWIGGTVAGVTAQTAGPDAVILDGVRHEVREDGMVR